MTAFDFSHDEVIGRFQDSEAGKHLTNDVSLQIDVTLAVAWQEVESLEEVVFVAIIHFHFTFEAVLKIEVIICIRALLVLPRF